MKKVSFILGFIVFLFCLEPAVFAADGFAEGVTGGAGGATVTATNATQFKSYVESYSTYIVEVSGTINLGSVGGAVEIRSNKTIRGINSSSTIIGRLRFQDDASNIIIERLNITNPYAGDAYDGISVKDRITNVFITHCTVYDCGDGCIDITEASDYVTISWCKFYYENPPAPDHRFVNLIGAGDTAYGDRGKLHVTFHHNWWSTLCHERMPRVRFGRVHIYNNYYDCPGNMYCASSGVEAECLIENNYFNRVDDPYYINITIPPDGKIRASGNTFVNCTGIIYPGEDDVFTPPYSYSLDDAIIVPSIVQLGAGADGSDIPPTPPGFGTILFERWTGISGGLVSDLTSNPAFPDNPTGGYRFSTLETPTNWTNSYGTRIRGYLHPPTDGSYTFWVASNDNSELWLSTDGNPANASLIANVPGWTNQREWDKYPSNQQSSPIYLNAGQKYYIEVLHKEDTGDDNLAVAWEGPDISQQLIYGIYLSPWFSGFYGDFTDSKMVDMNDLSEFVESWLEDDCGESVELDLNGDCIINFYEFSALADNWLETIPDSMLPSIPTDLWASAGNETVWLDWDDNSDSDLSGYNIYRSTTSGDSYSQLNTSLLTNSSYTDNGVTNGTMYYYVTTAVDMLLNESRYSVEACAVPGSGGGININIQENATGFCNVNGNIENENSGYTGYGYANTENESGAYIIWMINILSSGTYTFTWRFANGSSDSPAKLLINSSTAVPSINFPSTGAWTNWSEVSENVSSISTGYKYIILEATGSNGLPNIDYLMVTGPNPQVASCPVR